MRCFDFRGLSMPDLVSRLFWEALTDVTQSQIPQEFSALFPLFSRHLFWWEFASSRFYSNLKPMYSLGKWWKFIISLTGFVYRVVGVLKALWIKFGGIQKMLVLCKFLKIVMVSDSFVFYWEICIKLNIFWMPQNFNIVMYIAPSIGIFC